MPSIASRLTAESGSSLTMSTSAASGGAAPTVVTTPVQNTALRCPLPYVVSPSPDSLRQFYGGGSIPQYRITPPPPLK